MNNDDQNLREDLERGLNAQHIYDDLRDRFEGIRDALHKEWAETTDVQDNKREECWRLLKALNTLEKSYFNDIRAGQQAKSIMEAQSK